MGTPTRPDMTPGKRSPPILSPGLTKPISTVTKYSGASKYAVPLPGSLSMLSPAELAAMPNSIMPMGMPMPNLPPMPMMPMMAGGVADPEAYKKLKSSHAKLQKDNAKLQAEHSFLQNQVVDNAEQINALTTWVSQIKAEHQDFPSFRPPDNGGRRALGGSEPFASSGLRQGSPAGKRTNTAASCISMEPVGSSGGIAFAKSPAQQQAQQGRGGPSRGGGNFSGRVALSEADELTELRGAFGSPTRCQGEQPFDGVTREMLQKSQQGDRYKGASSASRPRTQKTNTSLSRVWVAGEAYDSAGGKGGSGPSC